jgi:prevent-host-death family protein
MGSDMVKISSAEFQKNFGRYQDIALTQPVTVTRNGRERTVLLSVEEYARLKRRDRLVMGIADFTAEDIEAIARAVPPADAARFDGELE